MDNQELLQKIPAYLSKHLEIYENIHKDIDVNDQHSMHYMRASPENNASHLQQFVDVSSEFAETISRLKESFTELYNRYNLDHDDEKKKVPVDDKEKPRISNFDMFVSEHCKNSAKIQLGAIGEPLCE